MTDSTGAVTCAQGYDSYGVVTTTYALDLGSGLTQRLTDGSNIYMYGVNRIGEKQTGGWRYYAGDALGSVRQLVDNTGAVTLAKSYQPFGTPLTSAGAGTTIYGFTGEQRMLIFIGVAKQPTLLLSGWISPRFETGSDSGIRPSKVVFLEGRIYSAMKKLFSEIFQCFNERWDIFESRFPLYLFIQAKIFMNQHISNALHFPPGHIRKAFLDIYRDDTRCLTNGGELKRPQHAPCEGHPKISPGSSLP